MTTPPGSATPVGSARPNHNQNLHRPGRAFAAGALATALALSAVAVPALDARAGPSRDAVRVLTLQRLDLALRAHLDATGELPESLPDPLTGGWESSRDGRFLASLVAADCLDTELIDPLNEEGFHLLYHRYPAGTEGSTEPFYVLALTAFEGAAPPPSPPARRGDRDWSQEYPFAIVGP